MKSIYMSFARKRSQIAKLIPVALCILTLNATAAVTELKVSTGKDYSFLEGGTQVGTPAYMDRPYEISLLSPGLNGCDLIQTSNSDDIVERPAHLTFTLPEKAYVYVAYASYAQLPDWLDSSWQKTFENIEVQVLEEAATYHVYVKEFAAGQQVVLGGNNGRKTGSKGHYIVMVNPFRPEVPAPDVDRFAHMFSLNAKVVQLEYVALNIESALSAAELKHVDQIRIYRADYEPEEIGYATGRAKNFVGYADFAKAKLVEEIDRPQFDHERSLRYEDRSTEIQTVYAYWIAVNDNEYAWGPVGVKHRDPSVWMHYDTVYEKMQKLAAEHPDLVSPVHFGKTVQGRNIDGLAIGNTDKALGLVGSIHAGEAGAETIMRVTERMPAENQDLLQQVGLVILPLLNADEHNRLIEGHVAYLRMNSKGVDLNRNYPWGWDKAPPGARGVAPYSEPETQAVKKFFTDYKPEAVFSWHQTACIAGWRADTILHESISRELDQKIDRYARAYYDGYNFDGSRTINFKRARVHANHVPGRMPAYGTLVHGIPTYDLEGDNETEFLLSNQDLVTPAMMDRNAEQHYHAALEVIRQIADPTRTAPIIKPNESARTGVRFETDSPHIYKLFQGGAEPWTMLWSDRPFQIVSLTAGLEGQDLLQTPLADEFDTSGDILRLTLKKPVTIHVCRHERATQLPAWMNDGNWKQSEEKIKVRVRKDEVLYKTYAKRFEPGTVDIGGNDKRGTNAGGNYFLIFAVE